MFEISQTRHWGSIVRIFFVISGFVTSRMVEHTMAARAPGFVSNWRSPVAAAIMGCGLIPKHFESSLRLKNRGSYVQACGVIWWRNSVDFVDIRSRYLFFSKTSIYCKIKTIAFLFAFFVLYCLVYCTPGIILTMNKCFNYSATTWAPWRFRTKTTPNKRPKLCMTNPLWGLQSSVPSPHKEPFECGKRFHVMRVKVSEIRDVYQIPRIETLAEILGSATVCSTAYSG